MKTFKVELNSFYGIDCTGCGHDSEESIEIQVEDNVATVLTSQIQQHGGELTSDEVCTLIHEGNQLLEPLHENLMKSIVDMDIRYWLEEGDADPAGTLTEQMEKDIESGEFSITMNRREYEKEHGFDHESDDYDEEEVLCEFYEFVKEKVYIPWLNTLTLDEHAQKVGLDIDAVIEECKGEYSISIC